MDAEYVTLKYCVNVSKKKYEKLKCDPLPRYCSFCKNEMPFSKMSNNDSKMSNNDL